MKNSALAMLGNTGLVLWIHEPAISIVIVSDIVRFENLLGIFRFHFQ